MAIHAYFPGILNKDPFMICRVRIMTFGAFTILKRIMLDPFIPVLFYNRMTGRAKDYFRAFEIFLKF